MENKMKIDKKLELDKKIYGNSFELRVERKWFNPFRYIFGKIKRKRISPNKIFIK